MKKTVQRREHVTVSETADGIRVEFQSPSDWSSSGVNGLYDGWPCCFIEAVASACGLPADWRGYARLELEASVEDPVDLEWAVIGLLFCSAVGIVFGLLPAIRAARLDPVEALRYE